MGTVKGYRMYVSYAVFSAEQVISLYEKKYPKDRRPRNAIEAAKKCIDNPTKENKATAASAYASAYAAAYDSVYAAADSDSVYAAAAAADSAFSAATDSAYAAVAADDSAYAAAASSAKKEIQTKIINYGLKLFKEEGNEF